MKFIIKRRLAVALAFAFLFSTGTSAPTTPARSRLNVAFRHNAADWATYTVKDEEFSVSLPIRPGMFRQTTYFDRQRKREERVISAYADGVVFVVHSFDNPKRRQSLDEVISEFNPQASEGAQAVTLGGFSGKAYSLRTDKTIGASHFYITDKHVYLFRVLASTLGDAEAAVSKFITSLRLEKNPVGQEVVEGLGEQPAAIPLQPGEDEERVFTGKETTHKAVIVLKPEPRYTEAARQDQVTGTVVLRAVFSSSGSVIRIRAISGLPYGLTERAIMAARQIKYIPAIKDGRFVSMWFQLEYNFNLF
jgi:TonB family protein